MSDTRSAASTSLTDRCGPRLLSFRPRRHCPVRFILLPSSPVALGHGRGLLARKSAASERRLRVPASARIADSCSEVSLRARAR